MSLLAVSYDSFSRPLDNTKPWVPLPGMCVLIPSRFFVCYKYGFFSPWEFWSFFFYKVCHCLPMDQYSKLRQEKILLYKLRQEKNGNIFFCWPNRRLESRTQISDTEISLSSVTLFFYIIFLFLKNKQQKDEKEDIHWNCWFYFSNHEVFVEVKKKEQQPQNFL